MDLTMRLTCGGAPIACSDSTFYKTHMRGARKGFGNVERVARGVFQTSANDGSYAVV